MSLMVWAHGVTTPRSARMTFALGFICGALAVFAYAAIIATHTRK